MYLRKWVGLFACLAGLFLASNRVLVQSPQSPTLSPRQQLGPSGGVPPESPRGERDLLYVASPATDTSQNGPGILVFDVWDNFKLVKRIHTFDYPAWQDAEQTDEVKGFAVNSATAKMYLGTLGGLSAFDMITEKMLWRVKVDDAGADRLAVSPDGKLLYVPKRGNKSDAWVVVDPATGAAIKKITDEHIKGSHNTIYGLDGSRVFMESNGSRYVTVADTKTHTVIQSVGPFGTDKDVAYAGGGPGAGVTRPFTVNGKGTTLYVTIMGLLGFEVGDVRSGKVLYRVEVSGYPWTRDQLHGEGFPSHGIAISPDEKEIWLTDNVHGVLHIFDATVSPPRQMSAVRLPSKVGATEIPELAYPYWVTFGLDGKYVFPSTGDVIEAKTRRLVTSLTDEFGRPMRSEKIVEVHWKDGRPDRNSDQFGRGMVTGDSSTR